ncbi:pirin family protein [Thalassotalea ponticola]|uniref:pirin family protein n=1 Tax=Thalassotalea ponticola TaxID=1523392 RepID=UPI0025B3EE29|nr:pirin family protein [Thalassotalea ponticola]MDN3653092.1 pirin family protein [Thalassotalea ponticola]
MQILQRDSLPLGGFAGLTEHRLITDSRLFGHFKSAKTFEGMGQLVYLADARFNPHGETGMHPHREIDVISVMVEGRADHAGSLQHGAALQTHDVQVQRAGGEGFSHNEINPDNKPNRMIQLWALPETHGERAGYKSYHTQSYGRHLVYGGDKQQSQCFDSTTFIEVVHLAANQTLSHSRAAMLYITQGEAQIEHDALHQRCQDGDLIRTDNFTLTARQDCRFIFAYQAT